VKRFSYTASLIPHYRELMSALAVFERRFYRIAWILRELQEIVEIEGHDLILLNQDRVEDFQAILHCFF